MVDVNEIVRSSANALAVKKEEFIKSVLESSGLDLEEFVESYYLEEGPVKMVNSYGRDLGLNFDRDVHTVIFEQEIRLRRKDHKSYNDTL